MCQMKLAVCVLTFKDQCCFLQHQGSSAQEYQLTCTELGPNRNTCELTASAPCAGRQVPHTSKLQRHTAYTVDE
jgi:hypothetical protein